MTTVSKSTKQFSFVMEIFNVIKIFLFQCLHEQIRYVPVTPFLVPHLAMEDGELGTYRLPKGTAVKIFTFYEVQRFFRQAH